MKTLKKTFAVSTIVLAGMVMQPTVGTEQPEKKASRPGARIGTYDSRAIGLAYIRSDAFDEKLEQMNAELEKAKAAGDKKRVQELEAWFPTQQAVAHKQTFGTAPVDDILEPIKHQIPGITKQANVDLIISKWDTGSQWPDAEFVDVTLLMIQPFNPDESTLKMITEQLPKLDPIPSEKLEKHEH